MLFNSFQFLLFFILVWLLFLVTRGNARKVILLIASYYFYMCWSTRYIFVIWGITLIDYVAGLQIAKAELSARRRCMRFNARAMWRFWRRAQPWWEILLDGD